MSLFFLSKSRINCWCSLKSKLSYFIVLLLYFGGSLCLLAQNQNITLDENSDYYVNAQTLNRTPIGGDTIFIDSSRKFPLRFQQIEGDSLNPLVVINKGGQVKINDTIANTWGAITFEDCKYIKISGAGHPGYKYGFELAAVQCGLAFSELSSDCEAEFIKISHEGFFGIMAKKNYDGNPPNPVPIFENLIIHDCFIENVSEGMYLGETTSPGMEFKHVKIYNNIVRNTQRESIQIANMVEDVEIYNNTMINAGLEGAIYHLNNLQIGDNTVANIYNNILMDAPAWGIINMGRGNVRIANNYMASNEGIFCDNRTVSDSLAPIEIEQNYFRLTDGNQVIRNMNEMNFLTAIDNKFDTNITFYLNQTGVNNDSINNNTLTSVSEIQFEDVANNDYSLAAGTVPEYLGIGAPGGPEFFEYDDPATTSQQILITSSMVIDSVASGSVSVPSLLFDEQDLDIDANEHAVSSSWKPDYAMNESSYHAIIDLKNEYHISEINLHDMNSTFDFTVEYLDSTLVWNTLFVDPLDSYNTWKKHATDISSRYLRFSMYDDVFAAVNEITVYGYPLVKESEQVEVDSTMVTDLVLGGSVDSPLLLFDEQNLDVTLNEHPISNSWKPFYTDVNAPYCAIVDLGQDYYISEINLHDMNGVYDFEVEYGDGPHWTPLLTESCDGFNVWKNHQTDIITRYLRLKMPQSPYAAVNEIQISGYPIMTLPGSNIFPTDPVPDDQQIIITSSMVTDLVSGGSVDSPLLLFDEQNLDVTTNEHAVSGSWKPYYNNTNAPYYATVDLQEEYHISKIYLHDMNSTFDFNVEYDDNSSWTLLFVEPLDAFNNWKEHQVDIETQHLRLGMLDSPYAAVNEIIIFGYATSNSSKDAHEEKYSEITQSVTRKMIVFPNPVKETLHIKFSEEMMGLNELRIIDLLGKEVFRREVQVTSKSNFIELDLNAVLPKPGFYLLKSISSSGNQEITRLLKK